MLDSAGQMLNSRYRIEALLGRGGMVEVHKAWDTRRQYHVAIKVMREDLARDVEFLRRFQREEQALAALSHANVIRFYSFEREGPLAFIVMDYVEGTTLRRRIVDAEGEPLPLDEVLSVARQICAALHYAHEEGVLHRDIKPGNIMIQPDGRVLVADFGIAKAADAATVTSVMPGTPAYMSPEQCRSQPVDGRTDVYSLGIVVYEMLAGRRPFVGETAEVSTGSTREKIHWEQMHAEPPPLQEHNPTVPAELAAVVLQALAKDAQDRWGSVLAFGRALGEVSQPGGEADRPTLEDGSQPVLHRFPGLRSEESHCVTACGLGSLFGSCRHVTLSLSRLPVPRHAIPRPPSPNSASFAIRTPLASSVCCDQSSQWVSHPATGTGRKLCYTNRGCYQGFGRLVIPLEKYLRIVAGMMPPWGQTLDRTWSSRTTSLNSEGAQ